MAQPDRVFVHFLDHEILRRVSARGPLVIERLMAALRICAMVSPRAALVPISAHHESHSVSRLIRECHPLIHAGFIAVVGTGTDPLENLEARKRQFDKDRSIFADMFASEQAELVQLYAENWEEKAGSTSGAIREWWVDQSSCGPSELTRAIYLDSIPSDRLLLHTQEAVEDLLGRPLIGQVVADHLFERGLTGNRIRLERLRRELSVLLTRQWASAYASALRATTFRDLGPGFPGIDSFADPVSRPISLTEAWHELSIAGLLEPIRKLQVATLASCLEAHADERFEVARGLFGALTGVQGAAEAWSSAKRAVRDSGRQGKVLMNDASSHSALEYSLLSGLELLADELISAQGHTRERVHVTNNKISIKGNSAPVNVINESSSVSGVGQFTSLAAGLRAALASEEAADGFVAAVLRGEYSGASITAEEVSEIAGPVADRSRLAGIRDKLIGAAVSAPVVVALIEAISRGLN